MTWSAYKLPQGLEEVYIPHECIIKVFKDEFLDCRFRIDGTLTAFMTVIAMQFSAAIQAIS
jgi:hypothetical protein